MAGNATPKPLSEKRIEQLRELYRPGSHYRSGDIEGLLAYIDELKAQPASAPCTCYSQDSKENEAWLATSEDPNEPHRLECSAPVPLAEDEALIAETARRFETMAGAQGDSVRALCGRLSLRSGQLAQVLALCDDAESTKQAKECIAGGGVICIQVPEIRAAIEGSK